MTVRRILVVEDNPKNMKLVRDVLEFSGYEVIEATTGEDGVRLAETERPHLILMDLQLPGIDGAEALRQIRVGPDGQDVPVVAVTAFAMDEDQDPSVRVGVRRLRREADQRAPLPPAGTRLPGPGRPTMTEPTSRPGCSSSTTSRRTSGSSRRR